MCLTFVWMGTLLHKVLNYMPCEFTTCLLTKLPKRCAGQGPSRHHRDVVAHSIGWKYCASPNGHASVCVCVSFLVVFVRRPHMSRDFVVCVYVRVCAWSVYKYALHAIFSKSILHPKANKFLIARAMLDVHDRRAHAHGAQSITWYMITLKRKIIKWYLRSGPGFAFVHRPTQHNTLAILRRLRLRLSAVPTKPKLCCSTDRLSSD